ncbi:G-protein coupled receptor [Fasciola hepatica]|uniref:G-protein coupled receptor n=1 Tax=Fasciola hepatica TaxID=6192 RepID=A0A4E0RWY0_FASHE|nr:G-protein coupled receptor [Fasciola hepatica]
MNKTYSVIDVQPNQTALIQPVYGVHIAEVWSALVVQTVVCLVGASLNILNVVVFSHRQFTASPYIFMTALAVADAGILLVHLPFGLLRCDRRIYLCTTYVFKWLRPYLSYYVTYVGFELGNMLEALSAWITVFISTERYITIRWPHLSKLKFSRGQAKRQVVWIAIAAVTFHLPLFFVLEVRHVTRAIDNNQTRRFQTTSLTQFGSSVYYYSYTWIRFILVQFIPLVTLCVMNSLLLSLIWTSYRNQREYMKTQFQMKCQQKDIMLSSMIKHRIEAERQSALMCPFNGNGNVGDASPIRLLFSRTSMSRQVCLDSDSWRESRATVTKPVTGNLRLERSQQANNKLSVLLVAVIFLFLIGQIPQAFAYVHILDLITKKLCNSCPVYSSLYKHLSQLLCLSTSMSHFFLYTALNRHFRDCLRKTCFCRS